MEVKPTGPFGVRSVQDPRENVIVRGALRGDIATEAYLRSTKHLWRAVSIFSGHNTTTVRKI